MSIPNLNTNFKDDILNTEVNPDRKYQMIYNDDGTVSFKDVTSYKQTGSQFGAKEVNEERKAINGIYDDRIKDFQELKLVTEQGFFVDALAVKELISEWGENYYKFANGLLIQWGSTTHEKYAIATSSVNLPVAYRDAGYRVSISPGRNGNLIDKCWIGDSGGNNNNKTANHFNITSEAKQLTYGRGIDWITIGRWK